MESMFEQMRRSMMGSWADQPRSDALQAQQARPALGGGPVSDISVTIDERDDGFVVLADLPGFEREEIDLTFDTGFLTIAATHDATEGDQYRHRSVNESVRVPGDVALEDVTASYRNGVLEVMLPVDEDSSDEHYIDIE